MDVCLNGELQITFTHSAHSHKNMFIKQNKDIFWAASLILKIAFDSVWHNGLLLKRIQSGIGGKTYDIIQDIYNGNKCYVKINDKRSDYFGQTKGVRQGCSLSPTVFNIYINELASALDKSSCPGLTLKGREIKCLLYAEDLLLLSPHEEGLHESLSIVENYSIDWAFGMEKSKIMIFQKKPHLTDKKYSFTIGGSRGAATDSGPPGQHIHSGPPAFRGGGGDMVCMDGDTPQ